MYILDNWYLGIRMCITILVHILRQNAFLVLTIHPNSSEKSIQSLYPSHFQDSGIQNPVFLHWNCFLVHSNNERYPSLLLRLSNTDTSVACVGSDVRLFSCPSWTSFRLWHNLGSSSELSRQSF